jgi:hypothetical protein
MKSEFKYDENLWFEHENCEGKHYMIGNCHTFIGRMFAYCPIKKQTFCISKSEIGNKSTETEYWIKGFLSGNEPSPPGDNDFESKEFKKWKNKIKKFEKTGEWK